MTARGGTSRMALQPSALARGAIEAVREGILPAARQDVLASFLRPGRWNSATGRPE